jgi:hypothetical protein
VSCELEAWRENVEAGIELGRQNLKTHTNILFYSMQIPCNAAVVEAVSKDRESLNYIEAAGIQRTQHR